ncbi:MAG: NAD-dependent epimerase/dehydratase family protein [Chloroflexi bacterium]|nr:NAD-dependent epimerase/dehydratase family protein [Chloroflexota bacterium]
MDTLTGKKVLVTGAAGFVGSRLVAALLEAGARVTAIVDPRQQSSRLEPLLGNPGLNLMVCPLTEAGPWEGVVREVELVAHLWVHMPSATDFCDCAAEEVNSNLLGTISLLKRTGPSLQGVCFSSSILVYGPQARLPVREEDIPHPVGSYAATKLALEAYLTAFSWERQIPATVLRYSTIYGPGERGHRLIPTALEMLARGQPPVILGDSSDIRDYVYIDDVVEATLRALERRPSRVLNIGSGEGSRTLEVAQKIMRLCGIAWEPRFRPRSGPKLDLVCDISAARETLGYCPRTDFAQGLVKEVQWYEEKVLGRSLRASLARRD